MLPYEAFGQWLRARREASFPGRGGARLAREALGRAAHQTPNAATWSKWENGRQFPGRDYLDAIEAMFGDDWPRPPLPDDLESQMERVLARVLGPAVRREMDALGDELLERLRSGQ